MKIERIARGSVTVLRPEDRLDLLGYLDLEESLRECLAAGRVRLVVDLSRVTFLSSTAIAVLARYWGEASELGGALALACPTREARSSLELANLDSLFRVFDDLRKAVRRIEEGTTALRRIKKRPSGQLAREEN